MMYNSSDAVAAGYGDRQLGVRVDGETVADTSSECAGVSGSDAEGKHTRGSRSSGDDAPGAQR